MTSRISKMARKSVVIIADKRDGDGYCSGCVLVKDRADGAVTVITSSNFVNGRDRHLKVVFFDREEFNATVVSVEGPFTLLRTSFHLGCEPISMLQDENALAPSSLFAFAPISQTANQKLPSFCTLESLDSYGSNVMDFVANSNKYFLVSCPYAETTRNGINRLTGAPVFTMGGKTAGFVLQNCRDLDREPEVVEIKVILKARHVHELMMSVPPAPPKKPAKKRKRCH